MILRLVVAIVIGHHGYMELEGGTQMIEFIFSQCSLLDDPPVSCCRSDKTPWLHGVERWYTDDRVYCFPMLFAR